MTDVVFRELTANDLDAVAQLESRVSTEPWSRELFAGELGVHQAERHWLVAEELSADRAILGFGGVMYALEDAHVMNIAIDPERQGVGLGRRLLANLVLEAIERGVRNLTLEVRVGNVAAMALYRRFRLAPVGSRPRYYPDGEDALILWAHDIDTPSYRQLVNRQLVNRHVVEGNVHVE